MKKSSLARLAAFFVLACAASAVFWLLPNKQILVDILNWVETLGPWGPILLALIYIPATVLCFPGSLLTLAGGAIFGIVPGTIAVSVGSTLGAGAAFLVARFLARSWIEHRVEQNPKFRAIDQAVAERGFTIVFLTRLSPVIPFTLLNYAFGLTRARFRDYLLASWIGMLPGTLMYVYLGSAAKDLAELLTGKAKAGTGEQVFFLTGLAATIAVTIYVTRLARQALAQVLPAERTNHE